MADQTNNSTNGDEVDLGQLFHLINKGFSKLFLFFLRVFLYFKKHAIVLAILAVVGVAAGFGLKKWGTQKLKIDVIVKPQIESKNYLYDVVDEVQGNISSKNLSFFKGIGANITDFKGYKVEISPLDYEKANSENEVQFLELLQSFENTEVISDIVRAQLQNKSSFNHRITFSYKNEDEGQIFAQKVMDYINSNEYFDELIGVYRENSETRIVENGKILKQLDTLIHNYTDKMVQNQALLETDKIVVDNQERINITGLFNLKNTIIKDTETKKIEMKQRQEAIRIINFGQPQVVRKSLFGEAIIFIPMILLGAFFLISLLSYLNRKSKDI